MAPSSFGSGLLGAGNRPAIATVAVLLLAAALVPVLNLATPAESAAHVPTYVVSLLGKYLAFALLALSVDLIWGYCGILSLGHGAFFALGGYAMGMYLMREIGGRGVYGNPELPDFMVFLNWRELPWYWQGFDSFPFALLMVMLVPGLLALVFGWFAFRSRVTGVYLSIITQALTFALMLAFFRNDMGFGGNNGLTDFKDVLGFDLQADTTRAALFALTALILAAAYLLCRFIVASRLGKVLIAIRDQESRVRFLGYRVEHYKLFVFVVSAVMAGIAGALYVPQVGIINPSRVRARQLDRDRHLGGDRRARHVTRRYSRRGPGQLPENLVHRGDSGAVAVRARRPVHRRDAVLAAGRDGPAQSFRRRWRREASGVAADAAADAEAGGMTISIPRQGHARPERHDTILYLDGVSVSFDGFKALNNLSLYVERRRVASDHRPERRRQDDDDGRGYRQDQARRGRGVLQRRPRPDQAGRGADSQSRHRPQVPEADGVREPHRAG